MLFALTTLLWLVSFSLILFVFVDTNCVNRILVVILWFDLFVFVDVKKIRDVRWNNQRFVFLFYFDQRISYFLSNVYRIPFSVSTGGTYIMLFGILFWLKEWVRPNSFVFSSWNDIYFSVSISWRLCQLSLVITTAFFGI